MLNLSPEILEELLVNGKWEVCDNYLLLEDLSETKLADGSTITFVSGNFRVISELTSELSLKYEKSFIFPLDNPDGVVVMDYGYVPWTLHGAKVYGNRGKRICTDTMINKLHSEGKLPPYLYEYDLSKWLKSELKLMSKEDLRSIGNG